MQGILVVGVAYFYQYQLYSSYMRVEDGIRLESMVYTFCAHTSSVNTTSGLRVEVGIRLESMVYTFCAHTSSVNTTF